MNDSLAGAAAVPPVPLAPRWTDHPSDPKIDSSARQLVLCLDGTSNTLTGRQRDTNVLRLFEHLAKTADAEQKLYYDPGVGSPDSLPVTDPMDWLGRKWERLSGLAYGRGIYDNVAQAYAFLMREWTPECEIYLFGFSRGAFTARCVAGMVNLFGVLRPEHEALLDTLMRVYFSPVDGQAQVAGRSVRQKTAEVMLGLSLEEGSDRTREAIAKQVRTSFSRGDRAAAAVHFVGVWDTVESVGLPGLRLKISSTATVHGKRLCHVRHALALDEHRQPFEPRLYTEDNFGTAVDAQSLRQLWFRGCHGDSGGGYAPRESALSDTALVWMADQAWRCGLRSTPLVPAPAEALAHDPVYTVPWWALAGLSLRDHRGHPPVTPAEHESVGGAAPAPASVWRTSRPWPPLLLALGGALLAWWLQGRWLAGMPLSLEGLADSAQRLADFARVQLETLWLWPQGRWREAWAPFTMAPIRRVLLADMLFAASYGYVGALIASWAFTAAAGYRRGASVRPWWSMLGLALPVLFIGDIVENLLTLLAFSFTVAEPWWRGPVLWLASFASVAKFAGLAALAFGLLPLGLWARRRGRPPQPEAPGGAGPVTVPRSLPAP